MRLLREDNARECVLASPPLARGGEASIYAVAGSSALVVKLYHHPTREQADKLAALLAVSPPPPAVAWPITRLYEDGTGRVVGCLLPRLKNTFRACEIYNPAARQRAGTALHYADLVRIARNLATAVHGLHERGCVVGDLNESNVHAVPDGRVTLVDADSFQIAAAGRVYRCRVGKPEYTPPELQDACLAEVDRRPEHDAFALATLIFQLLMQGLHPFAGVPADGGEAAPIPDRIRAGHWPHAWDRDVPYRPVPHGPPWCVLPPAVQELFIRCFEEGHAAPARRPGAAAWRLALEEAEVELVTCRAGGRHRYPRGLDVCPWCVLARQQGRDPFPLPPRAALLPPVAAVPVQPPPALDPDDPLPPRATPAAPALALSAPPMAPPSVAPVRATGRRLWVLWTTAIMAGTLVGTAGALWKFQLQAENSQAASGRPDPARSAAEAEQAWRQALADLQKTQQAWQQAARQHELAVKEFARGRITQHDLTLCAHRMRKLMLAVQAQERVLAEKSRVWSEAQQALSREKS